MKECATFDECLGAFVSGVSALTVPTGRAPVRRAELPWESRPAAELPFRGCALTPTHQPDFRHAQRLLRGIWQAALDTVPLFVIVSSDAEAALWTASAGSHMEIAPHEVLSLEQVAPDGERNLSTIEDKIAKAAPRPCAMAAGQGRAMGHIKKFYGLKYLGLTRGCDVVWALDCDSMPMRAFSFSEVFSRLGIVWVHEPFLARAHQQWGDSVGGLAASDMVDGRCIKNAQRTHKLMLGQQVARMALRQNDFWLYETRLLLEMMDGAVHGMPPGSSFLDAFLQGGLTSEQVVWLSWLVQHILNKALPNYTIADYTIATIAGNSRSLASCMNQTSTWVQYLRACLSVMEGRLGNKDGDNLRVCM